MILLSFGAVTITSISPVPKNVTVTSWTEKRVDSQLVESVGTIMIARIQMNAEYVIDNQWCKVIDRKQNPWMPDTITVRFANNETKSYTARYFRANATEKK